MRGSAGTAGADADGTVGALAVGDGVAEVLVDALLLAGPPGAGDPLPPVQAETRAVVPASEAIPASSWRRVGSTPGQRPATATAFPRAAPHGLRTAPIGANRHASPGKRA